MCVFVSACQRPSDRLNGTLSREAPAPTAAHAPRDHPTFLNGGGGRPGLQWPGLPGLRGWLGVVILLSRYSRYLGSACRYNSTICTRPIAMGRSTWGTRTLDFATATGPERMAWRPQENGRQGLLFRISVVSVALPSTKQASSSFRRGKFRWQVHISFLKADTSMHPPLAFRAPGRPVCMLTFLGPELTYPFGTA